MRMRSKIFKSVLFIHLTLAVLATDRAQAEEPSPASKDTPSLTSLDEELQSLEVPANELPTPGLSEKLYSVQTRYTPLKYRGEFSFFGGTNFNWGGFLSSRELGGSLRFYLSDRWAIVGSGSKVFNSFSDPAQKLYEAEKIIPDVVYAIQRADLSVLFHTFYGKFRLGMNQVLYFDHYVSLGPGRVWMSHGPEWAAAGDTGLAFWLGNRWTVRAGLKDYYVKETRQLSQVWAHHLLVHLDFGVLIGG